MLLDIDLNDCLVELPPYGSFPMWSFDNVESPVRNIEPVACAYPGGLEGPVACIYRATLPDGTTREILIEGDPAHRNFAAAYFLKDGRKTEELTEISKLIISDGDEPVPQSLKDAIRDYEARRDAASARLKLG